MSSVVVVVIVVVVVAYLMNERISGRSVGRLELHGQRSEYIQV